MLVRIASAALLVVAMSLGLPALGRADAFEQALGELASEDADRTKSGIQHLAESEDALVLSAKVAISELVDRIGLEIEEGSFETVGGYVLSRVGRVPAVRSKAA